MHRINPAHAETAGGVSANDFHHGLLGDLSNRDRVFIPKDPPLELAEPNKLNLIKLHGSINWRDRNPKGGEDDVLVLGGGKSAMIDRFRLLRAYHHLFRDVLDGGNVRLLVIGYSFGDPHINDVIRRAVETKGLKLFIVDLKSPRQMKSDLEDSGNGALWSGLVGFLNRPVGASFAMGKVVRHSGEARRLYDHFFRA